MGCNLDPYKWLYGEYPAEFKELMMAHFIAKGLVEMHTNDAQMIAAEREQKRTRGRR